MAEISGNAEKGNRPLVSIYTCTYNMADKIHRALDSTAAQTYRPIEHIIVNDGSTDGVEPIIEAYKNSADYAVKIINKKNGGKHTAMNAVFDNAEGEFLIQCDADDELLPNAIEFLVDTYYKIPEADRDKYWCVHGACVTQNGDFVGDKYPEGINMMTKAEKTAVKKTIHGEKIGLQKKSAIGDLRFPEPKYVRHVTEGYIWAQLNYKYDTWYTNEIARMYYVNEGGNLTDKHYSPVGLTSTCYEAKIKINMKKYFRDNRLKAYLFYAASYGLTTKEFRNEYGFFSGFDFGKKLLLVPFFVVSPILSALFKKFVLE